MRVLRRVPGELDAGRRGHVDGAGGEPAVQLGGDAFDEGDAGRESPVDQPGVHGEAVAVDDVAQTQHARSRKRRHG